MRHNGDNVDRSQGPSKSQLPIAKMNDHGLNASVGVPGGTIAGANIAPQEISPDQLVLIRIYVPELNVEKCLQFHKEELIWEVKQQSLTALPKVSFLELIIVYAQGLFINTG